MQRSQHLKVKWGLLALLIVGLGASQLAIGEESEFQTMATRCRHTNHEFRCVKFVRNYDGDTVTFDIPSVHPLLGKEISIRLDGVDTPEMHSDDPCERQAAYKAQEEVEGFLRDAKRIDLKTVSRGKYFRIVAQVIVDGKSLTDVLLKKGLGNAYDGGHKRETDWCHR